MYKKKNKTFEKDQIYYFQNKESGEIFKGTVSEFLVHIDKNVKYNVVSQIKNISWFKKSYKAFKNPPGSFKKFVPDPNLTYILKTCKDYRWCLRNKDKMKCDNCYVLKTTYYTIDEFNEVSKNINEPHISLLTTFSARNIPIKCYCNDCGYEFDKFPRDVIKGVTCPNCLSSKGEQLVRNYLEKHKIVFEKEKVFPNLKYRKPLRFDFYLPDYNSIIEFDGMQHFKPVKFNANTSDKRAVYEYEELKKRDKMKNDYCKKNHINILRIRYNTKNIEEEISKFIQKVEPAFNCAK